MAHERAYAVILTHAAQVDALRYPGGAEAVEARARLEISGLLEDGLEDVGELCFHTLIADSRPEFFCSPNEDGDLEIDALKRDETEPLESGPAAGHVFTIPNGFSS